MTKKVAFALSAFLSVMLMLAMLMPVGCALQNRPDQVPATHTPKELRISKELYIKEAPLDWEPYFTGEEPQWTYNPDEPWAWNADGRVSRNQAAGQRAHRTLYAYLEECGNYAGCYINSDGYLTVMMTEPTIEQAKEIGERAAAPVWIIAAKYPYSVLKQASKEIWEAVTAWIGGNPDVPLSMYSGSIEETENCVRFALHGSGVPRFLGECDFPEYVEFEYTPTVDASEPHDIPHSPKTIWERDGVTIKSARESYPIGATFILVTAGHTVKNQRLYAPHSLLRVEKYADGEWYDVSGAIFDWLVYREIFDIPAGKEKTVQMEIVTPETLGPGLYRATYEGHVCLSSDGDTTVENAIAGADSGDYVTFEFAVTQDAKPLPPREGK